MAKRVWSEMIGQQKTVEGYVFTIVGINGRKVLVDVVGEQFTIERSTWDRGVFKNQLRAIKPTYTKCSTEKTKRVSKYYEQTKEIDGRLLKVVKVEKNRLLVRDMKNNVEAWTTKNTWVKGVCKKLIKDLDKEIEKMNNGTYELSTYVFTYGYLRDALMNAKQYEYTENYGFDRAKVDYVKFQNNYWNKELEQVLNNEELNNVTKEKLIEGIKNAWQETLEDEERQWKWYYAQTKFSNCHTMSDVKKMYRELCSKEHPDKGGDAMKFRAIQQAYEEAKQLEEEKMNKAKVSMADLFAEFGF